MLNKPGLILVTGGARSGKSRFAAQLATTYGGDDVSYVATLASLADDSEMQSRIARHQKERNPKWQTVEAPEHLEAAIRRAKTRAIVVDCLTGFVSNRLLASGEHPKSSHIEQTIARVAKVTATACQVPAVVIMVTNEVGASVVPDNYLARVFRDAAGIANQHVAAAADQVWLCVAGLPLRLKPQS